MSFTWVTRTDDDWAWSWDSNEKTGIRSDKFGLVYPKRLARGAQTGRLGTRATAGTKWTITNGNSWDKGDLLRINDVDASALDLRELSSTSETVLAVAAHNVVSGALPAAELDDYLGRFASVWNVTSVARFGTTDVNSVTPTTDHIGQQASLDNSSGWRIDVTGSGDVAITGIDTNRGLFIVQFLAARIQDSPGD